MIPSAEPVMSPAAPRPRGFLPEVESLRGIAVTLVFLFHTAGWLTIGNSAAQARLASLWLAFVTSGHTGVSLFFIISAFLLSRPFLAEAAGGPRVDRRHYFERRALRILPLYWAAVVVTSIVCAERPADVWRGVPYLFFLNGVTTHFTRLPLLYAGIWWSLATEAQFYMLLPCLPLVLQTRRRRQVGVLLLLAYVAVYALFPHGPFALLTPEARAKLGHSLFGRAPLFGFGIAAAALDQHWGARLRAWAARTAWVRRGGADIVLIVVLIALAFLLRAIAGIGYTAAEANAHYWHVFEGALWTGVLLLLLLAPLRIARAFVNRRWQALGTVSYSIYMLHNPIMVRGVTVLAGGRSLGWNAWTFIVVGLLTAGCLALSAVTYWLIERPFLQRKARITR